MTELFLDGMPAVVNQSANIKLSVENIFFTKSSSYTYDVELPLAAKRNRLIFGNIDRIDIEKNARRLSARLVVDNVTVLVGEAHITSVSESAVKVQILGEAAAYNYGNKADKLYIDELDLGDWFSTTWPDLSYYQNENGHWVGPYYYPEGTKFHGINTRVLFRASDNLKPSSEAGHDKVVNNIFDGEGNYPWVAYPIHNSTADVIANNFKIVRKDHNISNDFMMVLVEAMNNNLYTGRFAIQPFIWIMAEKIAKATGLELNRADNILFTHHFFKRIFIANTNNFIECNKCLPHWTVNEWWSQLENAFGVVMDIDYATKTIRLSRRSEHYAHNAGVEHLSDVVDEFTTDIGSDTETDISANNTGFTDHENSLYDILPEDILVSAEINTDFATLEDLRAWAVSIGADAMREHKHIIYQLADNRQFIWVENVNIIPYHSISYYNDADNLVTSIEDEVENPSFVEVNMFRPRMSNPGSDNVEIELKIVPCRYVVKQIPVRSDSLLDPVTELDVMMLEGPGRSASADEIKEGEIDIEEILSEEGEELQSETNLPDCLYIAIANTRSFVTYKTKITHHHGMSSDNTPPENVEVNYRQGHIHERWRISTNDIGGVVAKGESPFSLSLIPIEGQTNLGSETVVNSTKIGTTVRHCFKFIADKIPDTGSIFIIRNKRFVCEKIEANIKPDGLDKLMTGYFYEFEM